MPEGLVEGKEAQVPEKKRLKNHIVHINLPFVLYSFHLKICCRVSTGGVVICI